MKFIFAENMDLVDPNFDFVKDRSSAAREPYWDDVYTHHPNMVHVPRRTYL